VPNYYDEQDLSPDERKSLTHGDFWIPEGEREMYREALEALNGAGTEYVVTGAHAVYEHTGIYRRTGDLDLFVEPSRLTEAMRVLREIGFVTRLEQPHWLAKAKRGNHFIDLIFGMGNGLAFVDEDWYRFGKEAILAATPVRVAPPEELIWHRLFISERHRQDMADIAHLMLHCGHDLDWRRLLDKTGPHWPLLLSQLAVFLYVYPNAKRVLPGWLIDDLVDRLRQEVAADPGSERVTRGTLISRFSFAIDVREWGFRDLREEAVAESQRLPVVAEIARSGVWDELSHAVEAFLRRIESEPAARTG
jgi:hypothetical protein